MNKNARGRLAALSSICLIHLHGLPHERSVFFAPENDTGGGGGGGGGNDEKPTLKQSEVNAIIAAEKGKLEKKIADAQAAATKAATEKAELEAQVLKEREERELAGKNEAEKQRIIADRAAATIKAEKEASDKAKLTADAERDAARAELKAERLGTQASAALLVSKVLPGAIEDALPAFLAAVEIDTDEKHKITAVRFGGVTQPSLTKAAEEWLKLKPHFAAAPAGGTGNRGQGGAGGTGSKPLHEMTDDELLLEDQRRRAGR